MSGGEAVVRDIEKLLPDLSERLSRTEIIARLRYEAEFAYSSAKRMLRRGGDGSAKSEARRDLAQRIDRILSFLIHDSLRSVAGTPDEALCRALRERLQARGQWLATSTGGGKTAHDYFAARFRGPKSPTDANAPGEASPPMPSRKPSAL